MIARILAALFGRADAPMSPRDPGPDFTSESARRYHESNQFGR